MSELASKGRPLAVVVLAAGQGKRMQSGLVKVLHEVAGRPMLAFPLELAAALDAERGVVVVGRDADKVREVFAAHPLFRDGRVRFVEQPERRGTGHAVQMARPALAGFRGDVLILYGDTPLLRLDTIVRMRERKAAAGHDLLILSAPEPMPGVIVRGPDGRVERIVELVDATPEERRLREGNTGVYLVDAEFLWKALEQVDDRNAQGELYVTDIVKIAVREGRSLDALCLDDAEEALGINTRAELARANVEARRRVAERLMDAGVTFVDPGAAWLDWNVEVGRDTVIEPGVVITGPTRIGERCRIRAHTVIESSELADDVVVGPSAHLRPGNRLASGVRIGNFVELKNSRLGAGVKADHLSYIGDADVGEGASFGCGAITVNYDWEQKHRTEVGAHAFVGCNANLIAPVRIGDRAYVAAGSTITGPVPDGALAVARERQRNVEGWADRKRPPKKKPRKAEE
ncbi:MAG: bifunctional UDP-N-acetylglucosamine diphosphorylase/glucosamine-1-phosphate N-acetyltransferase GlmU [Deltaproteobacteria bacterium]|nr:bifunctional UDP-N-acetylglucosamine diphosphorylase/glucosamine-1-phosphate N-acetyltransferase GlmU [Deltaproteobacteria bacterium]